MPNQNHSTRLIDGTTAWEKAGWWLALASLSLAPLIFKLLSYHYFEPRIDQAHYIGWIRDLRAASSIWPQGDQGLIANIMADAQSVLHQLAIRPYNDPMRLFNLVAVGLHGAFSFLTRDAVLGFNLFSILCNTLILIPVLLWVHKILPGQKLALLLAAALVGSCHYLFVFSPLGYHNLGIASLALTLYALGNRGVPKTQRDWTIVLAWSFLAVYSHWTNFILLPPAVACFYFTQTKGSFFARILPVAIYSLVILTLFSPALVFYWLNAEGTAGTVSHSGFTSLSKASPLLLVHHFRNWVMHGFELLSCPAMLLILPGLWVLRKSAPMVVYGVFGHLAATLLLPGFSTAPYLRTSPYLFPLALTAISVLIYRALKQIGPAGRFRTRFLTVGVVLLGLWHLADQGRRFSDPLYFHTLSPAFHLSYIKGQGELRPIFSTVERIVREDPLYYWSYGARDLHRSFLSTVAQPAAFPALELLIERANTPGYKAYLSRRQLDIGPLRQGYLLFVHTADLQDIRRRMGILSGEKEWNVLELRSVFSRNTTAPVYPRVELVHFQYRSTPEPPEPSANSP